MRAAIELNILYFLQEERYMMFSTARGRSAIVTVLCLMFGLSACDNGEEVAPTVPAINDAAIEVPIEAPIEVVEEAPAARRAVLIETLPYAEIDDQLVYGYLSFPADMFDPLPAIIVIHDQWGLDEPIREITRRLAADGFIVVAIDLFGGKQDFTNLEMVVFYSTVAVISILTFTVS